VCPNKETVYHMLFKNMQRFVVELFRYSFLKLGHYYRKVKCTKTKQDRWTDNRTRYESVTGKPARPGGP